MAVSRGETGRRAGARVRCRPPDATHTTPPAPLTEQVIVRFRPGVEPGVVAAAAAGAGGSSHVQLLPGLPSLGLYAVAVGAGSKAAQQAAALSQHRGKHTQHMRYQQAAGSPY